MPAFRAHSSDGDYSQGDATYRQSRRDIRLRSEQTQFSFRDGKPRNTTNQAKHKVGKEEDCGLINMFKPWKVDSDLSPEAARLFEPHDVQYIFCTSRETGDRFLGLERSA